MANHLVLLLFSSLQGYYHELCLRNKRILSFKIRRARVKGTGVRKASSPETEPNFYLMASMSKCVQEGVQSNSKKVESEPMADSMGVRTAGVPLTEPNFYTMASSVSKQRSEEAGQANSKIVAIEPDQVADCMSTKESKQTENGPKLLSPFEPRPLLESAVYYLNGCPERTTSVPTVVPVSDHEGCENQRQEVPSTTSQSDQDEADFIAEIDELLQLATYDDFGSLNENCGLHFAMD
jgi:hypothetical protein